MSGDVVERAKAALQGLGSGSNLAQVERYAEWLQSGGPNELLAEVEKLRAGIASVERFARLQALSDRARSGPARSTYESDERYWLDLLAIIERVSLPAAAAAGDGTEVTGEQQ